jgi:hypothetical protein
MVAMTQPKLYVADLRDPDQMNGERLAGQATLSVSCNCCVFSHLDDTIVVGKDFFRYGKYSELRWNKWPFESI